MTDSFTLTNSLAPHHKPITIKWDDYKLGRKHRAFDLLERLGARMTIVYISPLAKNGLTRAVDHYNSTRRKCVRINYITAHICEVELIGVG